MKLKILAFIAVVAVLGTSACATLPRDLGGPRTVVLEGKEIREDDFGKFITWRCTDSDDVWSVLVEVGIFSDPEFSGAGFVLYDGKNLGDFAVYQRQGLNRRWSWGSGESNYSFIIKPDDTGLYYDFSSVPDGETTAAKDVYECYT